MGWKILGIRVQDKIPNTKSVTEGENFNDKLENYSKVKDNGNGQVLLHLYCVTSRDDQNKCEAREKWKMITKTTTEKMTR